MTAVWRVSQHHPISASAQLEWETIKGFDDIRPPPRTPTVFAHRAVLAAVLEDEGVLTLAQ